MAETNTAAETNDATAKQPDTIKDKASGVIGKAKDTASTLAGEAAGAARNAAHEGKTKASEALTTASKLVENAADVVEEKIGPTYGRYARNAATGVSNFADNIANKDVDELVEDARNFVRKSPLLALGAAAAIGFAITRLAKIGTEADDIDA